MSNKALRNKEIAKTIVDQLGGQMFIMMTGSKDFVAIDDGVQFTVGSDAEYDVNTMRIVLTSEDTYDISAMKVDTLADTVEEKCAISGIYNDRLQDALYSCTGFFCTMSHSRTSVNLLSDTSELLVYSPNRASVSVPKVHLDVDMLEDYCASHGYGSVTLSAEERDSAIKSLSQGSDYAEIAADIITSRGRQGLLGESDDDMGLLNPQDTGMPVKSKGLAP